jgi:hypothetical protein
LAYRIFSARRKTAIVAPLPYLRGNSPKPWPARDVRAYDPSDHAPAVEHIEGVGAALPTF